MPVLLYIHADEHTAYLRKRYHQDNEASVIFPIYRIGKAAARDCTCRCKNSSSRCRTQRKALEPRVLCSQSRWKLNVSSRSQRQFFSVGKKFARSGTSAVTGAKCRGSVPVRRSGLDAEEKRGRGGDRARVVMIAAVMVVRVVLCQAGLGLRERGRGL